MPVSQEQIISKSELQEQQQVVSVSHNGTQLSSSSEQQEQPPISKSRRDSNVSERIEQFLANEASKPMTQREIARTLNLSPHDCAYTLGKLFKQGLLSKADGGKYVHKDNQKIVMS